MGVMELRRNILLNEPHIATETGNPVSFQTDMKGLLGECKVNFEPVQEGTGDPSPSNVRPITGWTGVNVAHGGANLYNYLNNEPGYLKSNGEIQTSSSYYTTDYMPVIPGEYYVAGYTQLKYALTNNAFLCWYNSNKEVIGYENRGGLNIIKRYQAPANAAYVRDSVRVPNITNYSFIKGDAYPITFPATGKNLLSITNPIYYTDNYKNCSIDNNSISITGNTWVGFLVPCKGNTQYTFSVNSGYVGNQLALRVIESPTILNSWTYESFVVNSFSVTSVTFTTQPDSKYLVVGVFVSGTAATTGFTVSDLQLELGSTATTYEPFTNTVYGGYVDCITGAVVATHKTITLTGTEGIKWSVYQSSVYTTSFMEDSKAGASINGICSVIYTYNGYIFPAYLKKAYNNKGLQFYDVPSYWGIETLSSETWNAKLQEMNTNGTPIQICYSLETPVVVATIDSITLTTLVGDNTIWTDTNGNLQIKAWKH